MTFLAACTLDELVDGKAVRLTVGDVVMAVVKTDDGVFAINDRCSHADVSLSEGEVEGCTLECWLHGSAFDLRTGFPLTPPAVRPVPTYATRIVEDGTGAVVEIDPTPLTPEKDQR
jgi:3-phenylpropionate/trans-cinnamate dioxygenase ferredoxin subunit